MSSEKATGYLPIGFSNRLKFDTCWINLLLCEKEHYYKYNGGKGKQRTQAVSSHQVSPPVADQT